MKQKMSVGALTVFIFMIQVKLFDDLHDLNTQIIGCLVMTKASFDTFFFKQNIYTVCQTNQSIHTRKAVSVDKSLFCQEVVLKESTLLYLKFDPCIHVTSHDIQHIRKLTLFEILDILCSLGDISKNQTAKGVSTTAQQQSIVAACDHIILTQLALEHLMICKAWLCTVHGTVDSFQCKIIRRDVFIIFEA